MCSSCKFLDEKDSKKGCVLGELFYCKAQNKYVYACSGKCNNYIKGNRLPDKQKDIIARIEEFYEPILSILKKEYNYEELTVRIDEKYYGVPNYILDNYKVIDKTIIDEEYGLVDYKIEI